MAPPNSDLGWFALTRVYLAQITNVNEAAGTIDVVVLDDFASTREGLEIPWGGFSMNGHKSSWMRYMPQLRARRSDEDTPGGDLVYVAFGPKGDAKVLGFASLPGDYAGFTQAKTSNGSKVPRGDWGDLRMGEFDARSCGGAYVLGDRYGALLLSAGPTVQMRLDKKNNEMRGEAGLWKFGAAGSYIKMGDVKRALPLSFKETDFSLSDPTATKEFAVHLENAVPGGVAIPIVDYEFGAVRDGLGVPVLGTVGVPSFLRERKRIWAPGGLIEARVEEVDTNGNTRTAYGPTAVAASTSAPTVAFDATVLSALITALTTLTVSATGNMALSAANVSLVSAAAAGLQGVNTSLVGTASATVEAPAISIGAAAASPAAHGDVVLGVLTALVAPLLALAQSMAALEGVALGLPKGLAWQTLATALAAVQAQLAAPPGPGSILSAKVRVE